MEKTTLKQTRQQDEGMRNWNVMKYTDKDNRLREEKHRVRNSIVETA
jgi:hypothetical protein